VSQYNAKKAVSLASQRGAKRHCENEDCSRPFYDLNRAPAECPYCGASAAGNVIERHEFEMAVRQSKGKSYRLVDPPPPRPAEIADEPATADEDAANLPPDVLIDVDEDDSESDSDVIVEEPTDEDTA